jgi:hypothetical protein
MCKYNISVTFALANEIIKRFLYLITALQVGRSRVRFPIVSLKFFIDIILPAALGPWS